MSTTTFETRIEVDEKVPAVHITREFNAPAATVFQAHVDPGLLVRWLGPRSCEMRIGHYDARTGGSYRYTHIDADGEYGFWGSFHEIRPGELIVQTFGFDGAPDGVALERIVFTDLGDGRSRLVSTSLAESFETRDEFVASGMEYGVREGYEKLDEVLAG
ncbi:SRPBCC family protein [Motilibacter aurantiacus]|uniref:SRPBCC family protein n=1 Tax=Motilibacter aurantiacus TaxID=2714955 RepID=UPI00140853D6|nr:SRPBCC family protein [Motilibacter aurantiacus]NHC47418.1 SRPBCC family protein [Motilibacter aurantiacus]